MRALPSRLAEHLREVGYAQIHRVCHLLECQFIVNLRVYQFGNFAKARRTESAFEDLR